MHVVLPQSRVCRKKFKHKQFLRAVRGWASLLTDSVCISVCALVCGTLVDLIYRGGGIRHPKVSASSLSAKWAVIMRIVWNQAPSWRGLLVEWRARKLCQQVSFLGSSDVQESPCVSVVMCGID